MPCTHTHPCLSWKRERGSHGFQKTLLGLDSLKVVKESKMTKSAKWHKVRCCGVDIGTFQRKNLAPANIYSLNFPRKKRRGTAHPGRALGSRPGYPGVRMCHYTWSLLWSADSYKIQIGRLGLCHSCGNRVPMVPKSRSLAVAGTAAAHNAGSGCRGPGKVGCRAEGPTPRKIECEPDFHLHMRRSSGTRGTTVSSFRALQEAR